MVLDFVNYYYYYYYYYFYNNNTNDNNNNNNNNNDNLSRPFPPPPPPPPQGGLVSYSMPDGDTRGGSSDLNLRDLTYDGSKGGGWLRGGLGQLTDGESGHTNFRVNAQGEGKGR